MHSLSNILTESVHRGYKANQERDALFIGQMSYLNPNNTQISYLVNQCSKSFLFQLIRNEIPTDIHNHLNLVTDLCRISIWTRGRVSTSDIVERKINIAVSGLEVRYQCRLHQPNSGCVSLGTDKCSEFPWNRTQY